MWLFAASATPSSCLRVLPPGDAAALRAVVGALVAVGALAEGPDAAELPRDPLRHFRGADASDGVLLGSPQSEDATISGCRYSVRDHGDRILHRTDTRWSEFVVSGWALAGPVLF